MPRRAPNVEQISQRRVKLGAGTLYAALDRLTGEGLIEVDREEIVDSRLRRYYRLTAGRWAATRRRGGALALQRGRRDDASVSQSDR